MRAHKARSRPSRATLPTRTGPVRRERLDDGADLDLFGRDDLLQFGEPRVGGRWIERDEAACRLQLQ